MTAPVALALAIPSDLNNRLRLLRQNLINLKLDPTIALDAYAAVSSPKTELLILSDPHSPVGRWANIFQNTLAESINDPIHLGEIFSLPVEELFPELYDNPSLTEAEREKISQSLIREKLSLEKALAHNSTNSQKFYEQICVGECPGRPCEAILKMAPVSEEVSIASDGKLYSFTLNDLIEILSTNGNNPYTGKPFSTETLQKLSHRYKVEIKLYRRSLA